MISLLAGLAAATALYALVLTFGRDPLPGADQRYEAPSRTPLPRPARLAPVPELSALQASAPPDERPLIPLRVEVRDIAAALRTPNAGVAVFLAATGGDFRWRPLSVSERRDDGAAALSVRAPAGAEYCVTLASASDRARHGYLARRVVVVAPGAIVRLSGALHDVRFDLPDGADQAGPLRLQRIDDRDWLPMQAAPSGLKLRSGTRTVLQLGAGSYELQDPLTPSAAQVFDVPAASGAVMVSAALLRAPGDRR